MTDQDPTQAYQAPAPPPVPSAAPPLPPAPPAAPFAAPEAPVAGVQAGAVATEPVAAIKSGSRPGRSKIKWLVAALVTVLVVGTAAGATLVLTADAGNPAVLDWTPANSVAYSELRLDLPGSQSSELAKVMKAFPGFEDQAAFPVKLSEVLDQLVGKATDGKMSYKTDIAPWFGGQVGASVGPIPTSVDAKEARALLLVSVKDATKATAWVDALVKDKGATTSTDTYNGVTITLVTPPAGTADGMKDMQGAYAVLGPVLAVGDVTSVKAAIDTKGKTGLATNAQFKEAEASVSGDRLGFGYVDGAAIAKGAQALLPDVAASMIPKLPTFATDMIVPWAVAAVRAEGGAFVIDTRSPHLSASGPAKIAESALPGLVPATTVFLAEGHDVGAALARTKEALAADPDLKGAVKQVEDALALVGGFDAVTGWIGEAGVAITRDGDKIGGGVVVTPTDSAAAAKLLAQLKAFIALGGSSMGLTVKDVDYNGTTITVVGLDGLGGLLGGATNGAVQAPADLSIAYAVTDEVVVLGYGTDFVKAVLDSKGGESLAKTERFAAALKQAGPKHAALVWLDVAAMRGLAESMVPEADRADYDANMKPYLAGFDSVIGTTTPGDKIDAGTLIIRTTGG